MSHTCKSTLTPQCRADMCPVQTCVLTPQEGSFRSVGSHSPLPGRGRVFFCKTEARGLVKSTTTPPVVTGAGPELQRCWGRWEQGKRQKGRAWRDCTAPVAHRSAFPAQILQRIQNPGHPTLRFCLLDREEPGNGLCLHPSPLRRRHRGLVLLGIRSPPLTPDCLLLCNLPWNGSQRQEQRLCAAP